MEPEWPLLYTATLHIAYSLPYNSFHSLSHDFLKIQYNIALLSISRRQTDSTKFINTVISRERLLTAPIIEVNAIMKNRTVMSWVTFCRLVCGCQLLGETYFLYIRGRVCCQCSSPKCWYALTNRHGVATQRRRHDWSPQWKTVLLGGPRVAQITKYRCLSAP